MKKIVTIILALSIGVCFSQSKRVAEKYFNNFEYIKSATLLEKIYKKGDSSFAVISRLADSYYFNANADKSEYYYAQLFKSIPDKEIPAEYYFRYAQSLKSNRNYKESDLWLLKFRSKSKNDLRGQKIENNRNYLNEYTKEREKIIKLANLSSNTVYSDFGTFIYGDTLIFSSTKPDTLQKNPKLYKWNNQPFLNVYSGVQVKLNNGDDKEFRYDVSEVKQLASINTKYHESSVIITKDGNTKYFTRNNYLKKLRSDKKTTVHLKLYKAEKVNGLWTNITEPHFNNDDYSVGHPTLSNDEKTLYFVSDMPGGIGGTDIYSVRILENGSFGEPENLGAIINTEGREMFPFMAADNTLYFSSDGHLGLGFLDVFSSRLEGGTFKAITNIGSPFNSPKDDFAFVIDDAKTYGYISSNRNGGKGDDDIYSFTIRDPEPPCEQIVKGFVRDKFTKRLLPNSTVTLIDNQGNEIERYFVGGDASFEFKISCNSNYKLIGVKRYYKPSEQTFLTNEEFGVINKKNIDLDLTDDFTYSANKEIIIKINPIYFDLNKSNIRSDASEELDKVVAIMKKYPELKIESGSYTDARGSDLYNEKLSERRAKSSVNYIISKGISKNRISGIGYGETKPVNKCVNGILCNEQQHQLNRRTEFIVIIEK